MLDQAFIFSALGSGNSDVMVPPVDATGDCFYGLAHDGQWQWVSSYHQTSQQLVVLLKRDQHLDHSYAGCERLQGLADHGSHELASVRAFHGITRTR